MTLGESATAVGEWESSHKPIVVAVDGSERNRSAIGWGAREARADGCGLVLVTALRHRVIPEPRRAAEGETEAAREMLDAVRTRIRDTVEEHMVQTRVVEGAPVETLLEAAEDARLLVVGKRGLGSFARVLVGSTSIALAGRSPVPVAIVPDAWDPEAHRARPVVLGVDPLKTDHKPTHLAFRRALRLGVTLVAVHGWEAPATYSQDADLVTGAVSEQERQSRRLFEEFLTTWMRRYPEVHVRPMRVHGHPATAVLQAAEVAQLVVLGRHQAGFFGGFAFGSVARAVLHYAETPVLVVPANDA